MPLSGKQPSSSSTSKSSDVRPATTKVYAPKSERPSITKEGLVYPLPVDLAETHRQSLSTLLLTQLYGGPVFTPAFSRVPPRRVLDAGCGSGFWSTLCHQHFARRGHRVSFVGMDIMPETSFKPQDMDWQFIQWDMCQTPWPLGSDIFDLVVAKDLSLSFTGAQYVSIFEEYIRVLKPGGVLEVWERDSSVRILREHNCTDTELFQQLGVYNISANTPFSQTVNPFLLDYNAWLDEALQKRCLSSIPCTIIGPFFAQESDKLTGGMSKRIAVPLSSKLRWERGITLSPEQVALRKTALEAVMGLINAFEPLLKDGGGKDQYEWDRWAAGLARDLLNEDVACNGECLEVGAWSARKREN
ncbi:S-adenosyl-L-methionine-dependent methyltransferase [Xylariales sp. AK1849]|nr:S-adenosyl-L-methionine-dependent methyltransferase [Xylariales sp. AK1849]